MVTAVTGILTPYTKEGVESLRIHTIKSMGKNMHVVNSQ